MDQLGNLLNLFTKINYPKSLLVILLSYLLYRSLSNLLLGKTKRFKLNIGNRSKTYLRLTQSALRYIFVIFTLLVILQVNNIDVSSVIAGVGLLGAIVGVAAQDSLKDIIRGFTIISDHYFSVGDVILYDDIYGKVTVIGLKTTQIKDIDSGDIISISNRNFEEARVVAPCINLEIPLPYELSIAKALKIMDEIATTAKASDLISDCICEGANHLESSAITFKLHVSCLPEQRNAARRAAHFAVLSTLEKHNISIPYNQLDIHQKP